MALKKEQQQGGDRAVIGIVGLGLMGGSLALALKSRGEGRGEDKGGDRGGEGRRIVGVDRDPRVVRRALETGVVDRAAEDLESLLAQVKVDLLFLAVPQEETIALVPELSRVLPPGALVTDMASTKEGVARAMEALPPHLTFLGGHPMTGSERQGLGAADPFLFENAAYVLTPTEKTPRQAVETVGALVREVGGEVIILSPERHDQVVAAVSHLPHLLAGALMLTVSGEEDREVALSLAAGSFRDCTRVAASSPHMWRRICLDNRKALLHYLNLYRGRLDRVEALIRQGREEDLLDFFAVSRELREKLPPRGKGFLTPLLDIVVLVEDTPGIIGEMATLLGRAGVNIAEIEVLRVREAEEGSIRFGFKEEEERVKALSLLKGAGIKAWSRE